jgi:DHA2 family multidrug resistance protein-like MFS transporter
MNAVYGPRARGVGPADTAAAGQSLGGAYDVARRIGGRPGDALRQAARQSFVHGLHVTLVVSAVLLLAGALAALRLPRVMECGVAGAAGEGAKGAAAEPEAELEPESGLESQPEPESEPEPASQPTSAGAGAAATDGEPSAAAGGEDLAGEGSARRAVAARSGRAGG